MALITSGCVPLQVLDITPRTGPKIGGDVIRVSGSNFANINGQVGLGLQLQSLWRTPTAAVC